MLRTILVTVFSLGFLAQVSAQTIGTSFYTVAPHQAKAGEFYVNYETGYSVRAMRPFGEDGVEQRAGIVYGISKNLNFLGMVGAVVDDNSTVRVGAAQFELMGSILSQKKNWVDLAVSVGYLREYLGTNVLMGRLALARQLGRASVQGNAVFEKPFAKNRDAVDIFTTFAAGYQIRNWLWAGMDAIGEDLEGFFEPDEAEGGAKVMFGPTVHVRISPKMKLRLGGGPIFYLTQSTPVSQAPRVLPPGKSGYTVRFSMIYGI